MRDEIRENLRSSMLLYAVTDRHWLGERTLGEVVRESLEGGVTFLQLREKNLAEDRFFEEAVELQELAREFGVPFVVNDNVEIALRMNADGVHVGQSDMEAGDVRALLGPGKILGVSAQTVEQAVLAEKRGADYLGVGAVFPTGSKDDADSVSLETLRDICQAVSIPVVAIGGITRDNICQLSGIGIDGIAVISAIYAQPDIRGAAEDLRNRVERLF
ncbi:MAG: thiamine phosphate synthase [bacterium]